DVATGETRRLLDVAGGASGNALTAEHELLRDASAISLDEIRLELLARDRDAVIFGERPGNAKRSTTRHDGHFVQRIVALHLDRADGVATFVIRGELPLLVLHHHRFALGAHHDLVLRVLEVGHVDLVVVAAGGEQRAFVHQVGEISPCHSRSAAREQHDIHVLRHRLVADVNPQNSLTAAQVGRVDDDLSVETAGTHQCGVKNVRTIRRSDEDDTIVRLEAVHFDQQLIQRLLALVVAAAEPGAAVATNGIDLVDEDDAGRVCLPLFKEITDAAGADADEHLDEVGSRHGEKWTSRFTSNSARKQRLAGARRANQKRTFRQSSAKLGELLRILQELDDLLELDLCFIGAGDVVEGDLGSIAGQKLRLRFAEAERLCTARLHGTEQEEPDSENQQIREQADENGGEGRARLLRLDLHTVSGQALHFVARVLHRKEDFELLDQAALYGNLVLEFAANESAALNGDLVDVVLLQLLAVLRRIGNFRRGVGSLPRKLDDRDGHEYDENPERELLRNLAPVRRFLWCLVWHLYRHY